MQKLVSYYHIDEGTLSASDTEPEIRVQTKRNHCQRGYGVEKLAAAPLGSHVHRDYAHCVAFFPRRRMT
jgi:hypothetical protein